LIALRVNPMNEAEDVPQFEVTRRFLLRFADLMSNGSNAANLLLAAELLQGYAIRALAAEERLRLEQYLQRGDCFNSGG
jgi:hypothetical protein